MDLWPTLYVFVLASFIGLGVIRRVSRLLHTPLMSITNAISAIAVVGSILVTGGDPSRLDRAGDRRRVRRRCSIVARAADRRAAADRAVARVRRRRRGAGRHGRVLLAYRRRPGISDAVPHGGADF